MFDGRADCSRTTSDRASWSDDALTEAAGAAGESISGQRRIMSVPRTGAMVAQPLLAEGGDALGVLVA